MKLLSHRKAVIWGLGVSVGCCAIGAGIAACSSSSSGGSNGAGACTNMNALQIVFNPMYSAFISSTSQHTFLVPAIVTGVSGATVTWSASDPKAVAFAPDPKTGGTTMTIMKSGPVTIQAQAGNLCGSAPLNVTQNTEDDWTTGNARYNNTNLIPNLNMMRPPMGGFTFPGPNDPSPLEAADGGPGPACTNCHGATATTSIFQAVEHTPEQTAGFSDQELIDIVAHGIIPDGGYYDSTIVPYRFWQILHKWSDIATPDQQKAIVVYLRALTPAPQTGKFNFGGIMPGGGMMMPPPTDDSGPPATDDGGTTDTDASDAAVTTPDAGADSTTPTGDATTD